MKNIRNTIYMLVGIVVFTSCATKIERLTFSKFIISDAKGQTEIKVEENGNIIIADNLIGTIDKEGTISDKNGTILASVVADDLIVDGDGNALIKIDENGAVDNGSGVFVTWSENGELMRGDETTGMKIFPVDKDSFQTASLLLFLHLSI